MEQEQVDDIDLLLTLKPNGWSTCSLHVGDKTINSFITHIFNDPYFDLLKALSDLIKGENSVTFFWYDEPGGQKIEINRIMTQQHKVIVSINEFAELGYDEHKKYRSTIDFEIKQKQLITIFYLQLRKIYLLLKDKEFAENRAKNFPFREFHEFENLVKTYLSYEVLQ